MFWPGREIAGLSRIVGLFSSVSVLYVSVFVSKIKNTNGEMKLNVAAWPRALGSSVSQLLKGSATSSSADVCLCRGQSHLYDMSNLNQAEIEEFMNEHFLFSSSLFPIGNAWCCYFNHSEEIDSCVKTKTVVKILADLRITAWLKCSCRKHEETLTGRW